MFKNKKKKDKKSKGKASRRDSTANPSYQGSGYEYTESEVSYSVPSSRNQSAMSFTGSETPTNMLHDRASPPLVPSPIPEESTVDDDAALRADLDAAVEARTAAERERDEVRAALLELQAEHEAALEREAVTSARMTAAETRVTELSSSVATEREKSATLQRQSTAQLVDGADVWRVLEETMPDNSGLAPLRDILTDGRAIAGPDVLSVVKVVGMEYRKTVQQLQGAQDADGARLTKLKSAMRTRLGQYQETVTAQEKVIEKLERYLTKLLGEVKEAHETRDVLERRAADVQELRKEHERVRTASQTAERQAQAAPDLTASMLGTQPMQQTQSQPHVVTGPSGQPMVIMPPQPPPQYMFMGGAPAYPAPAPTADLVSSLMAALGKGPGLLGQSRAQVEELGHTQQSVTDEERADLNARAEQAEAKARTAEEGLMVKVKDYAHQLADMKVRLAEAEARVRSG